MVPEAVLSFESTRLFQTGPETQRQTIQHDCLARLWSMGTKKVKKCALTKKSNFPHIYGKGSVAKSYSYMTDGLLIYG